MPLLLVGLSAVRNPTAIHHSVRVMVRPMHQPAEITPFVHSTKPDTVTHAERHTPGQIDVVCYE